MPHDNSNLPRTFQHADVKEIVSKLTLGSTHAIPRLQVPSVKVTDGPNGARGASFFKRTPASAIPNATCLGASWSTPLIEEAGTLLAAEAKARGAIALLAPTINIQRSPLGGRAFESFSEDPTLSGMIAAAYVNGLQNNGVCSVIKHFVANDQEHERNGQDSIVAPRPLREIYLRCFQIAEKHSRPGAYMTAYNKLNGVHCPEDKWLMQDLLRGEWGFKGLTVSDWYGTYSVDLSINNGLSLEMPGPATWRQDGMVKHLIGAHKIDVRDINARVTEVLEFAQRWTKASPDIVYHAPGERTRLEDKDHDAEILRRLAGEGAVLLKNDGGVLPVKSGKVAIIGPNAKARVITGGGSASLRPLWSVSPWEGLVANKPSGVDLSYALGCVASKFLPPLDECFTSLDGKPGFDIWHYPIKDDGTIDPVPAIKDHHGESDMFMADFFSPKLGAHFMSEVRANFTAPITGEYEFGLVATGQGRMFIDDKEIIANTGPQPRGSAFFGNGSIECKGRTPVEKGKKYFLRVTHDSRRGESAASVSGPFIVKGMRVNAFQAVEGDAAIAEAVAAAREADTVVLVVGLNKDWESEGYDRPNLSLPMRTDELVSAVAKANPRTVVVIQAGSAISMPWINDVAGVVQAWYGGNECGNGIADVVYGIRNPSGRLPLSFPKREEDIAAALCYKSARTLTHYEEGIWIGYKHHNARKITPLFPFGHGLSYTTFDYSHLSITTSGDTPDSWKGEVTLGVKNTGSVVGDHSVHFYTSPPQKPNGLLHPEVQLAAFTKVYNLKPGEERTVKVKLDKYAISHWDEGYDTWRSEVGKWKVCVGEHAGKMVAEKEFEVKSDLEWRGL